MLDFLENMDFSNPIAGIFPAARVGATEAGLDLLGMLRHRHGAISLHHAGGCREGAEPICLAAGTLRIDEDDRLLGNLDGVAIYVSGPRSEIWEDRQFILDAIPGKSTGFSLVGDTGLRFLTRSRVFDVDARVALGLPPL